MDLYKLLRRETKGNRKQQKANLTVKKIESIWIISIALKGENSMDQNVDLFMELSKTFTNSTHTIPYFFNFTLDVAL
nr:hypothetical protein Iba_chr12aCG11930 [Ipomoea batatas]GMD63758.1 hypothetical protein Iba_chr12bCG17930 [Ipomoea batatas]